jgi:hypothetical protein
VPAQISTSYVERSHLTLRQSCKRFARFGNGFSKKLELHCAAVALHVAYYNLAHAREPEMYPCNGARDYGSRLDDW